MQNLNQQEREALLIIADISGYTRFLISHKDTVQAHAHVIINDLIQAIIKEVEIPIEVAKFEGDAIFFYAEKEGGEAEWSKHRRKIGQNLIRFFEVFYDRLVHIKSSNMCKCDACDNIDKLRLKMVIHSGKALFYQLGRHQELAGVDVVIAHKLLKNSLKSDHYLLMTEQASRDIDFPSSIDVKPHQEMYPDIGKVDTFVYFPPTVDDHLELYIQQKGTPTGFRKLRTTMGIMAKGITVQSKKPSGKKKLSVLQFGLIMMGMFVTSGAAAATVLLLQTRSLNQLAARHEALTSDITTYKEVKALYDVFTSTLQDVPANTQNQLLTLSDLTSQTVPKVRLMSYELNGESVVLRALASSTEAVSNYITLLETSSSSSSAGLKFVDLEQEGDEDSPVYIISMGRTK